MAAAGPTSEINCLLRLIWPDLDHRTRYVCFSFAAFAHYDLFEGIREIVRVVMTIGIEQDLKRHSEIARCLQGSAPLCINQVAAVCRRV
jgi:hypothetical protein